MAGIDKTAKRHDTILKRPDSHYGHPHHPAHHHPATPRPPGISRIRRAQQGANVLDQALKDTMKEPILEPILRRLRLAEVLKHIPLNVVLLDIGCGTKAAFLRYISPRIQKGFGVDFKVDPFESGNLAVSQLRFSDQLPFPDATFDVVTMLAVLEHIEHEAEMIQEIHRVLVPGGKLVLTVPSVWAQPVLEFLAYRLKIVSEAEIRDHKRYYNREKLYQVLVEKGGFIDFRHRYFQLGMNNFCTVNKI